MNKLVIDGKKFENEKMLHNFFKKELDLPDYYGMNLNALWDCITAWIDLPIMIIWTNLEESKKRLGEKFVTDLIDLFESAKKELGDDFNYELK